LGLVTAATMVLEFCHMVKRQAAKLLNGCLKRAEAATSPVELRRFAQRLSQVLAAALAALSLPWLTLAALEARAWPSRQVDPASAKSFDSCG